MALCRIQCPHCEQDVEVDVTSVTRSRECPNCGKAIILQFTTRQKRARRTALMVPAVDAVEKLGEAPHADHGAPRALEGDVHDRMMHDPEVRQNIRRLLWGIGILACVILVLSVANHLARAPVPEKPAVPAPPVATRPERPEPVKPQGEPEPSAAAAPVPPSAPAPPPTPARPPAAPPVIVTSTRPPSEEERALQALRAFLNASDTEERLRLVRNVETMGPAIRAYYSRRDARPIPFAKITPEGKASKGSTMHRFDVHLPDGQKRRATVGRSGSGDYRVDWASFVIYSAMDWEDFMKQRPTDPVLMRLLMEPGSNYSGQFADSDKYLCVKLTDPLNAASPPVYGYAERTSAVGKSLNLVLWTYAGDPFPVMLMLSYPPRTQGATGGGDQALVEKLVGEGWLATGG